jgi:hypothetical protein
MKGNETLENGNSKRRWVLENLHMQMLMILFFVNLDLGFIYLLSKLPTILRAFQNLGLKKGLLFIYICQGFMWCIIT